METLWDQSSTKLSGWWTYHYIKRVKHSGPQVKGTKALYSDSPRTPTMRSGWSDLSFIIKLES